MLTYVACSNSLILIIIYLKKEELCMFNENLKAMRKAKGISQEELAIKINVVRQTILNRRKDYLYLMGRC